MESGYVLNFSDRTFDDFFYEEVGIDPVASPSLFTGRGGSKAKRLRSFIEQAQPAVVAKMLRAIWNYRSSLPHYGGSAQESEFQSVFFEIVGFFEGDSQFIDASEIQPFEPNETLEELVSSIRRDIEAKKPQAALDHLHTYCMKRFDSLIRNRGGEPCGKEDPLHSRVGRYVKLLSQDRELTPMTERIVKSSISVFEELNPIRNNQSLAHDNPTLLAMEEARFIFDSVTALLRFVKSVDAEAFSD
jgi:hypothetical protein